MRYEAGSLRIGVSRAGRALGLTGIVGDLALAAVVLDGGGPVWLAVAIAIPVAPLALLGTQLRFDERGVHWRPIRHERLLSGLRERTIRWADVRDVDIDHARRRLVVHLEHGEHVFDGLRLPDLQPDRDLLDAFIERRLAAHAWRRPVASTG